MKRLLAVFVIFMSAGFIWSQRSAGEAKALPEFSFSRAPGDAIVTALTYGGMNRNLVETTLYGDGRLERVVKFKDHVRSREETRLDPYEMEGLLRTAVEGGLMEWSRETIDRKARESVGSPPTTSEDDPLSRVTLRLLEYSNRKGETTAPAEIQIDSALPRLLKLSNPKLRVPEIDALAELLGGMEAYLSQGPTKSLEPRLVALCTQLLTIARGPAPCALTL